ncbi:hypothetical protein [Paracoccus haeundaensis]|uniref:hypothetical protein n=1 Tax=Paracoccus haeundaensis TaxID=225362 RepID=UPI001FE5F907|nr:hypothetical protein [Paracoccus haeundaensis]
MRGWWMIGVLALAGCGEHQGWNPNYQFGSDRYGQYLTAREAALVTGATPAPTIPIALPVHAPTAARIAGSDPVPIPATMGLRVRRPAP